LLLHYVPRTPFRGFSVSAAARLDLLRIAASGHRPIYLL
jgi:hypothetical protein